MTIKAKTVLEDKFWIVEDDGVRVGTLIKEDDNFILNRMGALRVYDNHSQLVKQFGADFLVAKINKDPKSSDLSVNGFPSKVKPYNEMYDINRKLPLFTKSQLSKSVYCAGYYLIKFNVTWLKSFCPKLNTLEQNEFKGPFKTEMEMKSVLKQCQ